MVADSNSGAASRSNSAHSRKKEDLDFNELLAKCNSIEELREKIAQHDKADTDSRDKSLQMQNHEKASAVAKALRQREEATNAIKAKDIEIAELIKDYETHVETVRQEYRSLRDCLEDPQNEMLAKLRKQSLKADLQEQLESARTELDKAHRDQVTFYNLLAQQRAPMEVETGTGNGQMKTARSTPTSTPDTSGEEAVKLLRESRRQRDKRDNDGPVIEDFSEEDKDDKDGKDGKQTQREKENIAQDKADRDKAKAAARQAKGVTNSSSVRRQHLKNAGTGSSSHSHKERSDPSEDPDHGKAPNEQQAEVEVRMDTDEKQYVMRAAHNPKQLEDANYVVTLEHILVKYGLSLNAMTQVLQAQDMSFFEKILEKNPEPPSGGATS